MKIGRVFWGVFFVFTGVLLLLVKSGVLNLHWVHLWRYWPLLLVLWGAALLIGKQKAKLVIAVLMAIALGLLIVGALSPPWFDEEPGELVELQQQEFVQPYSAGCERAVFNFSSGAGTFTVGDTSVNLLAATTRSTMGSYTMEHETRADEEEVRLALENRHAHWRFGGVKNWAAIKLNPVPRWSLSLGLGAASVDVDLRQHIVERLDIEAGAADVRVKLGDRADETRMHIHCGASSVSISVPESVGCEISMNAPLSSKNFREFHKTGSGTYQTDNFATASKKIVIDVEAGVSSLSAQRY